jgi:hypothetical protein
MKQFEHIMHHKMSTLMSWMVMENNKRGVEKTFDLRSEMQESRVKIFWQRQTGL